VNYGNRPLGPLQARGLITLAPAAVTDPKGLPVYTLEAVEAPQP
jgi:hypothetical protein